MQSSEGNPLLSYSKERSRADNFTPASSVGDFASRRIQSEVQLLKVVFPQYITEKSQGYLDIVSIL